MRYRHLPLLGGALLLFLVPGGVAAQDVPGCTFPASGTIDEQEWSAIQDHLRTLDTTDAFDKHPLVSDRQTLVKKGYVGKYTGAMALIAARRRIEEVSEATLARGCFVGMIESSKADRDIGAFEGKTFIWVDRNPADSTWRALQFPLEGASKLDAETEIAMPYALPDPTGRGVGSFAPAGRHGVYAGTLYRGSLETVGGVRGGRWMIQPPQPLTPPPSGVVTFGMTASFWKSDTEVMGCVVCDNTTCCPQFLELVYIF